MRALRAIYQKGDVTQEVVVIQILMKNDKIAAVYIDPDKKLDEDEYRYFTVCEDTNIIQDTLNGEV